MFGTRQWHLRTWLIWLLCVSSVVSFVVIGALLFLVRVPQISDETRASLQVEAGDLSGRSELILGALQTQLELLGVLLASNPEADIQVALERAVAHGGAFAAVYQIGPGGAIVRAAVTPAAGKGRREEVIGNDLSHDPLFLRVRSRHDAAWSDKYISSVSGAVMVGIGVVAGKSVLVGEVPLDYILKTLWTASGRSALMVSILDRRGEVLADSDSPTRVGTLNLVGEEIFRRALEVDLPVGTLRLEGQVFDAAMAYSKRLDWFFLVRTPSGIENPRIASTLDLGIAALVGSLLFGLLLAPVWATGVARPINAITERARRVAEGQAPGEWPRLRTVELNDLSFDLARMSSVLRAREQELQAIFDASPVGIAVLDPQADYAFVKANQAVGQLLAYPVRQLLGKTDSDLGLWEDTDARARFYAALERDGLAKTEAWLRRSDGCTFLAALSIRTLPIAGQLRTVWVISDITELRRIEGELRELNAGLEQRVQRRTDQLNQANAELSSTVQRFQLTLDELVRAEKLASLGSMVAGIAHELNTPLGNGVMAVSSLRGAIATFRNQSEQGLRRSMLNQLLEAMTTGTDIAARNLARAAELVTSFKQVAADQASSQRRSFALHEVTNEIVLTLRPLIRRSEVSIEVQVPEDLWFDSYPGPLGQVLTNLLSNAVTHAFEGRSERRIRIEAEALASGRVGIRVADNGCGIAEDLLLRIFDPFVTTRMGRGGTGLGLHIAHNLVVQVLGGSISVASQPGEGCCFTIELPRKAPVAALPA